MASLSSTLSQGALAARDFQRAKLSAVCDVQRPWAHGSVMRASRHPSYHEYNLLRVERDPQLDVGELIATCDEELAGLEHRRIDFEIADVAEPLREGFDAAGWKSTRVLWMLHDGSTPPRSELTVAEAPYDEVAELKRTWHGEHPAEGDPEAFFAAAREISMRRSPRVLVALVAGEPVGFAQLERVGLSEEITSVYVLPEHRGSGRGTAMTAAAIEAAGGARELWIAADDAERAKELYARLGFRGVWLATEVWRWP